MKTIYITKKINDSDNGSDKIEKKLKINGMMIKQ